MRVPLALPFALCALASAALAQTPIVIPWLAPSGLANTAGNTNNTFPWSRATASMRIQFIYDSSHFTLQGVTGPVVISRLRYRPYSSTTVGTWAGGSWPNVRVDLATAATDWAAPSSTFANNLGVDALTAYQGPVAVVGGSAPIAPAVGPWYIDIPLSVPKVYDPTTGNDLVIDIWLDGTGWTGTSRSADHQSTGSMASRVYNTTSMTATTGTVGTSLAAVVEVTHQPAVGLFPAFGATPRAGATPLPVQFTDATYTSDPGGVTAWAWDVDGDNVTDYTTQNPTHTYTTCGSYTVSLTATDANGSATVTRANFIVTDEVTPSFTWANLGGNVVQFTDTSTPVPTSWAWDLDGDGITDSAVQNPVWAYSAGCAGAPVRLTVNRLCRGPYSTTQNLIFAPSTIAYMTGSTSTSSTTWLGGFFDVAVTNPQGVSVCGVTIRPSGVVSPFSFAVYVTQGTYVGKDTNAALWRQVATGTGPAATNPASISLSPSFYLPAGNYGMAVYLMQPGGVSTSLTYNSVPTTGHPGPIATADLMLFPAPATAPGLIRTGLFGGGLLNPRIPNVTLHYSTYGLGGDAGYGFFAAGCAGSMGVSRLVHSARPTLGTALAVTVNNLPLSLAIMMTGFSNTASPFGPLPLDLTGFGAPGCQGRVSPDATLFMFGAGNSAVWNFGIPNIAALGGIQLYNQALAIDPGFNALGGVTSDAAGMIIGM
jgi:PKD repeat protein